MNSNKAISRRDFLKLTGITAGAVVLASCTSLDAQYISPLNNAVHVSPQATIIIRYGADLSSLNIDDLQFTVNGTKSGSHPGKTILADDHQTVIFKPGQAFTPDEDVSFQVSQLQVSLGSVFSSISGKFHVAKNMQAGSAATPATSLPNPPNSAFPDYLTLPQDIPHYSVNQDYALTPEGYIFVSPFFWTKSTVGSYLLILDNQGEVVYYQPMAADLEAFDFKVLSNGLLSYYNQKNSTIYWLDAHYKVVNQFQAGNGYTADLHDSLLLPNGNLIVMIDDNETIDMSKVVPGGKTDAIVSGLVLQQLDRSKNIIWQWRSWDHFSFLDSTVDLKGQNIDLIHGNGLALASDGNLLLSCRNLSEITKINLESGKIMWRLGGKANQFTFVNDQPFAFQHDISQLENGNITLFDNHGTEEKPAPSRALEYQVDEVNRTVTKVWSYTNNPPIFGTYMGNTQRLPDGNTFIGWGAAFTGTGYEYITMSEVNPKGDILFELSFDQPYVSYRAFRFPWLGQPDMKPSLAYKKDHNGFTLGYSWNGATEVAAWQVFGGRNPLELGLVDQKKKGGFETQTHVADPNQVMLFYQVAALDKNDQVLAQSQVLAIS